MQRNSKLAWLMPGILLICLLAAVAGFPFRASGKAGVASQASFSASGRVTITFKEIDSGRTRVTGVSGVTVRFDVVSGRGATPAPAQTDANGAWSRAGFSPGATYKATPSRDGHLFTPAFITFGAAVKPILDRPGLDFEARRQTESQRNSTSASGKVSTYEGRVVFGVQLQVELSLATGTQQLHATTDSNGVWSVQLPNQPLAILQETLRVRPALSGFRFDPPERRFTRSAASGLDFKLPSSFSVSGSVSTIDHPRDRVVFPDVNVRFIEIGGGAIHRATSDANGNFSVQGLVTGATYRVLAEKQGLKCQFRDSQFRDTVRGPDVVKITCARN